MSRDTWIHVRLTAQEREAFEALCKAEGCTKSALLRQMVNDAVVWSEQTEWDECA